MFRSGRVFLVLTFTGWRYGSGRPIMDEFGVRTFSSIITSHCNKFWKYHLIFLPSLFNLWLSSLFLSFVSSLIFLIHTVVFFFDNLTRWVLLMEVVVGIVDEVVVGFVGMVDGGDGGFGMDCFWVYWLNMVVCGRLLGE